VIGFHDPGQICWSTLSISYWPSDSDASARHGHTVFYQKLPNNLVETLVILAGETLDDQTAGLNEPAREEIERRAYELYLARGEVHGYDQDDWLLAERELKETQS